MQHSWTFPTQSFDPQLIYLVQLIDWLECIDILNLSVLCDLFPFRFLIINFNCLIKFYGILMSCLMWWAFSNTAKFECFHMKFDYSKIDKCSIIGFVLVLMRYLQAIEFHNNLSAISIFNDDFGFWILSSSAVILPEFF
jgi:uncharacterized membrane protein